VNPQLWRLIKGYMNESNFFMLERLFKGSDKMDQKVAALASVDSNFEPARLLLQSYPQLENDIRNNSLTWNSFQN
jgi:hypothetical protein